MSQVITHKAPYIQYGVHATSMPYCGEGGSYKGSELMYVNEGYAEHKYHVRFNKIPRFTELDGKVHSLYASLSLHCIVCSTFIQTGTAAPFSGYETLTLKHSVLTDDTVYFCCTEGCKNQLEATPNIYV